MLPVGRGSRCEQAPHRRGMRSPIGSAAGMCRSRLRKHRLHPDNRSRSKPPSPDNVWVLKSTLASETDFRESQHVTHMVVRFGVRNRDAHGDAPCVWLNVVHVSCCISARNRTETSTNVRCFRCTSEFLVFHVNSVSVDVCASVHAVQSSPVRSQT